MFRKIKDKLLCPLAYLAMQIAIAVLVFMFFYPSIAANKLLSTQNIDKITIMQRELYNARDSGG